MADAWDFTFGSTKFSGSGAAATAIDHNHIDTIISLGSHTTGKWYFEIDAGPVAADLAWGLCRSGASNASFGGGVDAIMLRNDANVDWWTGPGGTQNASGMSANRPNNNRLGIAVDLTGGKISVRNFAVSSTTWYGMNSAAADPTTGANCFDISGIVGAALFLCFTSNQNGADEAVTMYTEDVNFSASAPTGFTAWGASAPSGSGSKQFAVSIL